MESNAPIINWCSDIGTRDGTLMTDSYTKNCYFDKVVGDGPSLVKRPGTSAFPASKTGTAQGLFFIGQQAKAIVSDTIYDATGGTFPVAIPGVGSGGIPNGAAFQTVDNAPYHTSYLKSQYGLWQYNDSGTITRVTDVNYPAFTCPGIAYLDGVFYVMDAFGKLQGSALNDGTTWPALDFVQPDYLLGSGAGVARHLNYVVGFYRFGTQLFYDANAAPNGQGIALNPVLNASWRTGCADGWSIVSIASSIMFMGQDEKFGRGVYKLGADLSLTKVSTPYIDRILNQSNGTAETGAQLQIYATGIKSAGHDFYLLTFGALDLNLTLVYDLTSGEWHIWSSIVNGVEQFFTPRFYLNASSDPSNSGFLGQKGEAADFMQDTTTGQTVALKTTNYTDVTGSILVQAVTNNEDWNTMNWKRFAAMFFFADTVNSTLQVSFTDNDYQSFSVPRTVNLNTVRKMLRNCGSSRRRAWKMTHQDNVPLRLYETSLDMIILNR